MTRRLLMPLLMMAICSSLTVVHVSAQPHLEMTKIVLSQSGAGDPTFYAPYYVAQAKGFFREEGLDVSTDGVAGIQELTQITGGQAQFSAVTSFSVLSAAHGRPLVTVAGVINQYNVNVVLSNAALARAHVSRRDPIAKRIRALRGLRLGISSIGSGADTFARFVLPKYGMDPDKDVTLVTLGSCAAEIAALESGNVDGFLCGVPAPEQAEARGLGKLIINTMGGEVPELRGILYSGYYARPDFIQQNPQTVQAFVNAVTKALHFIHKHPDEAATISSQQNAGSDSAVYKATFLTHVGSFADGPVMRPEGMLRAIEVVKLTTPAAATLDPAKLIDNTFAEKAAKSIH